MHLTLRQFLKLMFWMQYRTLLAKIQGIRNQSRLLLSVLFSFIIGYLLIGYYLFHQGLQYVYNFPIVGTLLSQRILYLIFGFFFVMLVFSNLITSYTTLFRNRETAWFLTLPIQHRHLYLWKFIESLLVSSWALVFLSAPMMAAYGKVQQVDAAFYFGVAVIYIPFIILPSVIGSWLILLIIRSLSKPWMKKVILILSGILLLTLIFSIDPKSEEDAVSMEEVVSFEKLLQHTRISLSPGLPSAWVARSVVAWSQSLPREGIFYLLLLTSNAIVGMILSYEIAGRFFYTSWSHAVSHRTILFKRKAEIKKRTPTRMSPLLERFIQCIPFLNRPTKALITKDIRIFWRDPTQWTQFGVFFGLLCIYVLNLRNVAYDFRSEFWGTIISYLNLGACSLTLSTLTTRFVFPQFSLEGRRLWIIGLAPIGLHKIILQKFWGSCIGSSIITMGLMTASSMTLKLEWPKVLMFSVAIAIMSASLSGLSVGLGALFPNLKEDNPSKIVSGFGGTLCLVVSFIYIILFISFLVLPASLPFTSPNLSPSLHSLIHIICISLAFLLSMATLFIPLGLALKKVKCLEF